MKHRKRRIDMKRMIALLFGSAIVSTLLVQAQAVTPFKLGTFQTQARTFVGIVLRDSFVVDFAAASRAITPASNVALPFDMKDLIARYDSGLRDRIIQVVRSVDAQTGASRAYVYDLAALMTMPTIMYTTTMIIVEVNYTEIGDDMVVRVCCRAVVAPQGYDMLELYKAT